MSHHRKDKSNELRPLQLAAYADGELDAACCREVEAWLADHPEAAAEVESYWRLAQLWQTGAPPEPAPLAWAVLRERIEASLAAADTGQPVKTGRAWNGPSWMTAAALLLAVFLAASGTAVVVALALKNTPPPEEGVVLAEPDEPFPVVTRDDVAIISMNGADTPALVVGDPPLPKPLVLALPHEMTLENIEGEADDGVRRVGMGEGPDHPMLIVPLPSDPGRDE